MGETEVTARIVLTTVANPVEAGRLARALVEERLAACATVVAGMESVYRWKGEVESTAETMVLIKTEVAQLAALEKRLHELHSYETPEFLVVKVEAGSAGYLEWLRAGVRDQGSGVREAGNEKDWD